MSIRLAKVEHHHPWTENPGWLVHIYECDSHEESEREALAMYRQGWWVWIVANVNQPSFVVYKWNPDIIEIREAE